MLLVPAQKLHGSNAFDALSATIRVSFLKIRPFLSDGGGAEELRLAVDGAAALALIALLSSLSRQSLHVSLSLCHHICASDYKGECRYRLKMMFSHALLMRQAGDLARCAPIRL